MKRNGRKNNRYGLTAVLSVALVCMMALYGGTVSGLAGSGKAALAEETAASEPVSDPSPAIYVTQKNANSVVGVLTNEQAWNRNTGEVENELIAQGSGVVIAEGGYILTNNHVIEDGMAYQILMPSGDKVDAWLVGADSSTDLAVLKVDEGADQLTPVAVGSVESLQVGSTVVAIGNPGGEVLANTVTQGVVSALERTSVNSSNTSRRISYIQHDAAINSGNSGGGLFNYKGELVGINTLKYSGSAYTGATFEGLGFAIPVETVQDITSDLMQYGKVQRAQLGIKAFEYDNGPDEPMNNYAPMGVYVSETVEDGPAAKAGLQAYDYIYSVDGVRVTSMTELTTQLDKYNDGDTVTIRVARYENIGVAQSRGNDYYSYFFGNGAASGSLEVSGGYEYVDLEVTLRIMD